MTSHFVWLFVRLSAIDVGTAAPIEAKICMAVGYHPGMDIINNKDQETWFCQTQKEEKRRKRGKRGTDRPTGPHDICGCLYQQDVTAMTSLVPSSAIMT